MRIALASTPLLGPDGGDRQLMRLALELRKLGHDARIFTNALDREKCYPQLNAELDIRVVQAGRAHRGIEFVGQRLRIRSMQRAGMECLSDAIGDGFDIVNGHNYYANWPAARVKESRGIPAIWMCNEPPFWYHTPDAQFPFQRTIEGVWLRIVDTPAAEAMDAITVLDQKNAKRVRDYYGVEATVVRSGVDAEFFDSVGRADLRAELGLEGKFVLLLIGHASKVKGQRESLQALRSIARDVEGAHLVMVGGGVKWMYGPVAKEFGVSDRVTFLEGVSDDYLASLYATADVVLFPANQTWGLNVTEGMAARRAVVVADGAGVSEILQDGKTGLVIPYGNVEAIASAVVTLYSDPELRLRLGAAGHDFVQSQLSWENYAKRMIEVYERCLSS
jgi:glycosyltransferase involved in cell wall biosynthesis